MPLGAAFAEYARIARTEHLPRVDPETNTQRRQINRQLTVQESRHKPARDVCPGKRGAIHQAYRDGIVGYGVAFAAASEDVPRVGTAVEHLPSSTHSAGHPDVRRRVGSRTREVFSAR